MLGTFHIRDYKNAASELKTASILTVTSPLQLWVPLSLSIGLRRRTTYTGKHVN